METVRCSGGRLRVDERRGEEQEEREQAKNHVGRSKGGGKEASKPPAEAGKAEDPDPGTALPAFSLLGRYGNNLDPAKWRGQLRFA